MAKIKIEFEFRLPEGITQEQVQEQVDGQLSDRKEGRFPWAVETLSMVGCDILHEAIECAARNKFRDIHGGEHRVVKTASGGGMYIYKYEKLAEELVKSTYIRPKLIRKGFSRAHDD